MSAAPAPAAGVGRTFRWRHFVAFALAIVVIGALANLLGWNIEGWFERVWRSVGNIPVWYVLAALVLATLEAMAAAFAYFSILRFAFPKAGVRFAQVFAMYAASVALNTILPAGLGTLALAWMFAVVFPGVTLAGALAVCAVQKIFFVLISIVLYLYFFLTVGGTFDIRFGFIRAQPWTTAVLVLAVAGLVVFLAHALWHRVRTWWEQAKEGGQILAHPRAYITGVVAPEMLSWLAHLGLIAVILAGYAIPLTFHTLMRVVAYGSVAGAASVTPGGVGVNQAFAVLALRDVTSATNATAYSIGQQVLTTSWVVLLAVVLMTLVFGWTGGKQIVEESYADAKKTEEERRASKHAATTARRH